MKHLERIRVRAATHRAALATTALIVAALVLPTSGDAQSRRDAPLYKNANAPVEQRVEDLLSRMTQEEKIAQITTVWTRKNAVLTSPTGNFDPAKAKQLYPNGIGQFARPQDLQEAGTPAQAPYRDEKQTVTLVNAIQKWSIEGTRLGIPTLFHEEGLHGFAARGATHFPQAIGLASTWPLATGSVSPWKPRTAATPSSPTR